VLRHVSFHPSAPELPELWLWSETSFVVLRTHEETSMQLWQNGALAKKNLARQGQLSADIDQMLLYQGFLIEE
jgi:hypothetical protein